MLNPFRRRAEVEDEPEPKYFPAARLKTFKDQKRCPKCGRNQTHPDRYCKGYPEKKCFLKIAGEHMHVSCSCNWNWAVKCADADKETET